MKYKVNDKGTGFNLLAEIAAVGIASGAVWSAMGKFTASPWIHQYFRADNINSISQLFTHTALSALIFLTAVFISGTSAVGQPAALGLLFCRGFGAGSSAAAIYSEYGLKAFPAVALTMLPLTFCMLITAVIAVRESLRSSCGLSHCMAAGDSYDSHAGSLKLYIVRFIVLAFISIAVSAAHAVLIRLSGSVIHF